MKQTIDSITIWERKKIHMAYLRLQLEKEKQKAVTQELTIFKKKNTKKFVRTKKKKKSN